jgi:hypothetical protein
MANTNHSMSKRSVGRVLLALPLLYGLVPVLVGYLVLRDWAYESAPLVAFGALFLLGGAAMVSSALCLLVTRGRSRRPLWIGGSLSLLSAGIFAWATLTDVLPCSGPA